MNHSNQERRAVVRHRTMKKGTIVFSNRYCSTNCSVRNESPLGAMLQVYQNHVIPSEIEVSIYPSSSLRPAEIVWRTPEMVGIKYLDVRAGIAPEVPHDVPKDDVVLEENRITPHKEDEKALAPMRLETPYDPDQNAKEPAQKTLSVTQPSSQPQQTISSKPRVTPQRPRARGFGRRKLD